MSMYHFDQLCFIFCPQSKRRKKYPPQKSRPRNLIQPSSREERGWAAQTLVLQWRQSCPALSLFFSRRYSVLSSTMKTHDIDLQETMLAHTTPMVRLSTAFTHMHDGRDVTDAQTLGRLPSPLKFPGT